MNISSEIFPTDGSNSSDYYYFYYDSTLWDIMSLMSTVCSIIFILFGFCINSYVIWLIVTGTGNRLAAECFSLNLAVAEIIFCVYMYFWLIYRKTNFSSWETVLFLEGLVFACRPLFQCLICVERYLAVVHPVTFLKYKPLRYRVVCSVTVWVTSFVSGGITVSAIVYNLMFITAQLMLYLSVQLFCCVAVLRALKQSGPGERKREREEENHMKRKAFYLILIITGNMVITYAPYCIPVFIFMSPIYDYNTFKNTYFFYTIAGISFSFGGLVQPLLFLHRVGKLPFTKCK